MLRGQFAALHVLGRPRVQRLADPQHRDKNSGAVDLIGIHLDPLDRTILRERKH